MLPLKNEDEKPPVRIEALSGEPWVRLGTGASLANWGRDEEIAYNQNNRQMEKLRFYRDTFDFLTQNDVQGGYYEFGCHRCRTFRMALSEARRHNVRDMDFIAFDSFQGLPEPTNPTAVEMWKQGALSTSESEFMKMIREHGIYVENVRSVAGYYDKSLTKDLQKEFIDKGRKISLVNIDCDLYESAVPVFNFIEPLLQEGAVIYVDDMLAGFKGNPTRGVARAFLEYRDRSRWKFIRHMDIGWWGRSYIVYPPGDAPLDTSGI